MIFRNGEILMAEQLNDSFDSKIDKEAISDAGISNEEWVVMLNESSVTTQLDPNGRNNYWGTISGWVGGAGTEIYSDYVYKVTFDGVEYKLTSTLARYSGEANLMTVYTALGNGSLYNSDYCDSTDEPFFILHNHACESTAGTTAYSTTLGELIVFTENAGTHTVKIERCAPEKNDLPMCLIPELYGRGDKIHGRNPNSSYQRHSLGGGNWVGRAGTAVGYNNISRGFGSVAIGWDNDTKGTQSYSLGCYNNLGYDADESVAIGSSNRLDNDGVSIGWSNYNVGNNSITIGFSNRTTGMNSIAIGNGTIANKNTQTVLGKYNIADTSRVTTSVQLVDSSNATAKVWNFTENIEEVVSVDYCYFIVNEGFPAVKEVNPYEKKWVVTIDNAQRKVSVNWNASDFTTGTVMISSVYCNAVVSGNGGDGKYALIVGNGSNDSARSDAYKLDWNGNGEYSGNVDIKGGQLTLGETKLTEDKLNTVLNSSRKMQLIDTIVLNGSTKAVYLNTTPSGDAYDFEEIMIIADGNGSAVGNSAVLQLNGEKLYGSQRVLTGYQYSQDCVYMIMKYNVNDGIFTCYSRATAPIYALSQFTFNNVFVDRITAIEWQSNGVTPAVGATIKIYGR